MKTNILFFDRKPAFETPWTNNLWICDLRTNMDFTLKFNPLSRADDVLATEIVGNLRSALAQFEGIEEKLSDEE